jgi:hypothetical protein
MFVELAHDRPNLPARTADTEAVIDRFYGLSAGLLRVASLLACLIVVISFLMFATDQLGSVSSRQAAQVAGPDASLDTATTTPSVAAAAPSKPAPLRRAINRTSQRLTSPFDGFVGARSSQWLVRSVEAALALLVYGFGMGYLVRLLRVRC